MPVYKTLRYRIRPEARLDAERAMHEFATYVRGELPGSAWTMYRDPHDPAYYLAILRAEDRAADARHGEAPGTRAFAAAIAPFLLEAEGEIRELELVTSSDLARRHRPDHRPGAGRRPR
ncbi:MAG TPA: hypothetical protein VNO30_02705 [Kofleriaceae bacterium]|nr:hypothetical protein [Kofleriaceae bacterium]